MRRRPEVCCSFAVPSKQMLRQQTARFELWTSDRSAGLSCLVPVRARSFILFGRPFGCLFAPPAATPQPPAPHRAWIKRQKCARHVNNSTQARFGRFGGFGGFGGFRSEVARDQISMATLFGMRPDFIMFSFRGVGFLICAHLTAGGGRSRGRGISYTIFCLQMWVLFFLTVLFSALRLPGCGAN